MVWFPAEPSDKGGRGHKRELKEGDKPDDKLQRLDLLPTGGERIVIEDAVILICVGHVPQYPIRVDQKTLLFDIESPHLVNGLTISILPCAVPKIKNKGWTVCCATEVDPRVKFVTSITEERLSDIVPRPFGLLPQACEMGWVKLSLETKTWCDNLEPAKDDGDPLIRPLAVKLADNLKHFALTVEKDISQDDKSVAIPNELGKTWYEWFMTKWNRDRAFKASFF